MRKAAVVAPHPDDETLGCGGTIKKLQLSGFEIVWVLMTDTQRYKPEAQRAGLWKKVSELYNIQMVNLAFEPCQLGSHMLSDMIAKLRKVFDEHQPEIVFLPHPGDAHSDHLYSFRAAFSCLKSFRSPYVRKILCYETLSETNFANAPHAGLFRPNTYVDVSETMFCKLEACELYKSEFGTHPFPRSIEAVKALATLRGSEAGCPSAEAFEMLYNRELF